MNNINRLVSLFILLLSASQLTMTWAEQPKALDCSIDKYNGKAFPEVYKSAGRTSEAFCKVLLRSYVGENALDNAYIGSILADFGKQAKKALDDKGLSASGDYRAQFRQLDKTFSEFDSKSMKIPEFIVERTFSFKVKGYFTSIGNDTDRFTIKESDRCGEILQGENCQAVFEDFADAFNAYRSPYDNVYDNSKALTALASEWDHFLDVSKSQSPLEVILTTWAHNDHFRKNYLVGPPDYQVIALHPHLIYDSMDKAPDGSNQEIGLAVEWLGVNFWDWKLPLGISLTSVYVDRAAAENIGHGVMLHFDNRYSIGWARHDDEDSFYITIDLLKLFENKKRKYDRYMKYF